MMQEQALLSSIKSMTQPAPLLIREDISSLDKFTAWLKRPENSDHEYTKRLHDAVPVLDQILWLVGLENFKEFILDFLIDLLHPVKGFKSMANLGIESGPGLGKTVCATLFSKIAKKTQRVVPDPRFKAKVEEIQQKLGMKKDPIQSVVEELRSRPQATRSFTVIHEDSDSGQECETEEEVESKDFVDDEPQASTDSWKKQIEKQIEELNARLEKNASTPVLSNVPMLPQPKSAPSRSGLVLPGFSRRNAPTQQSVKPFDPLADAEQCMIIGQRSNLVGSYQGQSALHTTLVVYQCLAEGKVLFIDEVYQLFTGSTDSYGKEVINTITQLLSEYPQLVCVIAGYSSEIQDGFFAQNHGLERRFPYRLCLKSYNEHQLKQILLKYVRESGYRITDDVVDLNVIRKHMEIFKNGAGDILHLYRYMENAQHKRTFLLSHREKYDIVKEDFVQGLEKYQATYKSKKEDRYSQAMYI